MSSKFTEVVIDCHDPRALAVFWSQVLGYEVIDEDGESVEIGHRTGDGAAPELPTLLFERVPESKIVKNRVHLDVTPVNIEQSAEVERLLALGARHVDIGQGQQTWVVLADPEGNEFCVLRPH
jgi:Glyoxalase-like domain